MHSADTKLYKMILCAILFRFLLLSINYEIDTKNNHDNKLALYFTINIGIFIIEPLLIPLFIILNLSFFIYRIILFSLNTYIPLGFNMLIECQISKKLTISENYFSIIIFSIEKDINYILDISNILHIYIFTGFFMSLF